MKENGTQLYGYTRQSNSLNSTIPTTKRVSLASFHLEGDAHLWYQLLH